MSWEVRGSRGERGIATGCPTAINQSKRARCGSDLNCKVWTVVGIGGPRRCDPEADQAGPAHETITASSPIIPMVLAATCTTIATYMLRTRHAT